MQGLHIPCEMHDPDWWAVQVVAGRARGAAEIEDKTAERGGYTAQVQNVSSAAVRLVGRTCNQ